MVLFLQPLATLIKLCPQLSEVAEVKRRLSCCNKLGLVFVAFVMITAKTTTQCP